MASLSPRRRRIKAGRMLPRDDSQDNASPAAYSNLPLPTPALGNVTDKAAAPPLVTQHARAVDGFNLQRRVSVVTITQTSEPSGNTGGDNIDGPPPTSVPTGIIVGSVVVGVILAVAIVGIWVWWGRRLKRKDASARPARKTHTSQSSTTHLNPSIASNSRGEKAPQPRPHSSSHSSNDPQRSPASGRSRRSGQPPVSSVHSASAGKPRTALSASPRSTLGGEIVTPSSPSTLAPDESPRSGPVGKLYAPQKSSPLAARPKPQERPKVNEWANAPAPVSPTRSSSNDRGYLGASPSHGDQHLQGSSGDTAVSHGSGEASAASVLGVPQPAHLGDRKKDRISVLSADSYYEPEDQEADYGVGMAYGGEESSPLPEGYPSPHQQGTEEEYRYGSSSSQHQDAPPQYQQGAGGSSLPGGSR